MDGSQKSNIALDLSIHFAERFDSRVDLLHVIQEGLDGGSRRYRSIAKANNRHNPDQILFRAKNKLNDSDIRSQSVLRRAYSVSDQILKLAKSRKYGLVAVGSSGVTGRKGLLLGSVSSTVAADANCSVLIAKRDFKSISRILLGYDGSKESKTALVFCASLARRFRAEVEVVGVVLKRADAPESPIEEAIDYLRDHKVESRGNVIDAVDVGKAISKEAKGTGNKLIVVGSGKFKRVGSLILGNKAADVIDNASTNVIIAR